VQISRKQLTNLDITIKVVNLESKAAANNVNEMLKNTNKKTT